jgi:hypothetical protein
MGGGSRQYGIYGRPRVFPDLYGRRKNKNNQVKMNILTTYIFMRGMYKEKLIFTGSDFALIVYLSTISCI